MAPSTDNGSNDSAAAVDGNEVAVTTTMTNTTSTSSSLEGKISDKGTAATQTKKDNDKDKQKEEKQEEEGKKTIEYNSRWTGYTLILICSVVNFGCVSTIPTAMQNNDNSTDKTRNVVGSAVFGVLTFFISAVILIQDRSQKYLFFKQFHYNKVKDGYFEGLVLLGMVVWWIIGVSIQTKSGGIAYKASNIYYSSWLTLFTCLYTLNLWSGNPSCGGGKDILSVKEIVGVSHTLPSWWILCIASCIVFGSAVHIQVRSEFRSDNKLSDTPFAIILGLVSMFLSFFHILIHYNFFTTPTTTTTTTINNSNNNNNNSGNGTTNTSPATSSSNMMNLQEGGLFELLSSFMLIFFWLVGVAIFTDYTGIAATMDGSECKREFMEDYYGYDGANNNDDIITLSDCTVTVYYYATNATNQGEQIISNFTLPCHELPRDTPGSNLYYSVWICFLSSIDIALKWKAAQALQFASQSATAHHARSSTTQHV